MKPVFDKLEFVRSLGLGAAATPAHFYIWYPVFGGRYGRRDWRAVALTANPTYRQIRAYIPKYYFR